MLQKTSSLRFIIILIVGLFEAEVISMGVIAFLPSLPYWMVAVVDATIMSLLAAPLLYFFSLRPLIKTIHEREEEIAQRKQAEESLHEREKRERELMQTLYTMQIDIARDLHDTIGQNIGFLRMRLAHLSGTSRLSGVDIKTEIKNMSRVADESYDLIRGTLAILQTEDSTDLPQLFKRYTMQIEERSSFMVDFTSNGDPKPISAKRMRQLFYIIREALSNIEKHAEAERVKMDMKWEADSLFLRVEDNGRGFNMENPQISGHYGLKFMKERVALLDGIFEISSKPGQGTKISIRMPYEGI